MYSTEYEVKGKTGSFILNRLWMRGRKEVREGENVLKTVQYGFYEIDYENKAFE